VKRQLQNRFEQGSELDLQQLRILQPETHRLPEGHSGEGQTTRRQSHAQGVGELNGQWNAIQPFANSLDAIRFAFTPGLVDVPRRGPVQEQANGIRNHRHRLRRSALRRVRIDRQRLYSPHHLSADIEWLATGCEDM
jgi:hypothetical protein